MTIQFNTDTAIENLVAAYCGENASARDRHLYRESLRGLVRLAICQQAVEMKMDTERATGRADRKAASFAVLPRAVQGAPVL